MYIYSRFSSFILGLNYKESNPPLPRLPFNQIIVSYLHLKGSDQNNRPWSKLPTNLHPCLLCTVTRYPFSYSIYGKNRFDGIIMKLITLRRFSRQNEGDNSNVC